jgi:indolepyruvate ferredoxin oxidoreductase
MERDLIGWYVGLITRMEDALPRTGAEALLPIAEAAMDIRGYGPVKEKAIAEVKARVDDLLSGLDAPVSVRQAA